MLHIPNANIDYAMTSREKSTPYLDHVAAAIAPPRPGGRHARFTARYRTPPSISATLTTPICATLKSTRKSSPIFATLEKSIEQTTQTHHTQRTLCLTSRPRSTRHLSCILFTLILTTTRRLYRYSQSVACSDASYLHHVKVAYLRHVNAAYLRNIRKPIE